MSLFDFVHGDELNIAEDNEPEFNGVDVTLDSGAVVHVMDRFDAPGHDVVPSSGSQRGQYFVAANGEHIHNEGKTSTEMHVPRGGGSDGRLGCDFQIAKVSRPLMSMSKICDKGLQVLTTKKSAVVMTEAGQVVAEFDRVGGLYVASVRMKNPRFKPKKTEATGADAPFGRQGKR